MGNLCSNVRPRYKIYVIGVFDDKINDLCSFANLYPNQLPRIGRYLLKQLNIRVQQYKSKTTHKDIQLAMQAWNDLIFSCNTDIDKFESHILQSMILLFAEQSIPLHVLAMKTLRTYLPYSHKMSIDELLSFVDSCTALADSDKVLIRIDALKTLSIIFTHLRNSAFCPDLYTKYERIIRAILANMHTNPTVNEEGNECDIYAEHCYEQFCSLISTNTLSIMLQAMSAILTEHYGWSPTAFVIKLLDILALKSSSIQAISIVQEILHILSNLHHDDSTGETFVEYIDRLNTMDSVIIALQQFSSRVISKNGTKINRNPILSKLCGLLLIIDETSAEKSFSMDISAEKILKLARNLLNCIQCYVIDISYIDSQSVLLRMIKYFDSKSTLHTQLLLKCVLRTLAHRTGKIKASQHTQEDIMKKLLNFHLKQQHLENSDMTIEILQLAIQNILILSSNNDHLNIGFDQNLWAVNRVEQFLESQIRQFSESKLFCVSGTSSPTQSCSSNTQTSSVSNSPGLHHYTESVGIDGFTIYDIPINQREWLYATIYSYLENGSKQFTEHTLLRVAHTIIIIAISPHNFQTRNEKKIKNISSEIVDFELLIPVLISIQTLANKYWTENAKKESVICHSIIFSVLLYVRNFLHCFYSKKTNYRYLFHKFTQIIDNVYGKCAQNNEIWSEFYVNPSGLLTVGDYYKKHSFIQITDVIPFDDIIESLTFYFELIQARRLSNSTRLDSWKVYVRKDFPIALILNNLCTENAETDLEVSISGISQSILLTPSRRNYIQQHRYVNSTASFDMQKLSDDFISNELKSLQFMKALDTLHSFNDMTQTYSENIDTLNRLQLCVTGLRNKYTANNSMENSDAIQAQTFTFDMAEFENNSNPNNTNPKTDFFERKQLINDSVDMHRKSDLSSFYIEYENRENPLRILHNGLCKRLDLMDLDLQMSGLKDVECELNELNYGSVAEINQENPHFTSWMGSNEYNTHEMHEFNSKDMNHIQSPMRQMRQLKAKGKSAVIHIRNRTRQLTQQMSVKTMQNFKNTPSAIRQSAKQGSHAIMQKTKQGSKAIKEKFQTVKKKIKMFEQLKKERDSNHKFNNVHIEMVGSEFAKPPKMNLSKHLSIGATKPHNRHYSVPNRTRIQINEPYLNYCERYVYNSADDERSYTLSTARTPSPPSKGSINTV